MSNLTSSSSTSIIYKSRKTILNLMERQNYNVSEHSNFSINEINSMYQNKQLSMILEQNDEDVDTKRRKKIYICYYLEKSIRLNIDEIIEDLFITEHILTKEDTLFIITKQDANEPMVNDLKHIWEKDGIFIVLLNIHHLQFNKLDHSLVPPHRIVKNQELEVIKKKYNIKSLNDLPEISRFDPIAQIIGIRPGQVCEITRSSKTSITAPFYRYCVN